MENPAQFWVEINTAAEERSAVWACCLGNAEGLGGFTRVNRLSLTTIHSTGMGFFGLMGFTSALAATLLPSAVVNAIGIGLQRGTHANWQIVHNSGSGAPTLVNLGASFPVDASTNALTLFLYAAYTVAPVWVHVVEEVSGAIAEVELTANLPAATQILGPASA